MADVAHDPRLDAAFTHLRQATEAVPMPVLRSRTQSAHHQPQYQPQQPLYPPSSDEHDEPEATATEPHQHPQRVRTLRSHPQTQYAAVANGREVESRVRSASAGEGRKGGDLTAIHHSHQSVLPRNEQQQRTQPSKAVYTAAPPVKTTYNEQREQQRLRQAELARRMAASTVSSTSAAYMELVSPARPLDVATAAARERVAMANGPQYVHESEEDAAHIQRRVTAGSAAGASRREAPSRIMQEFDDELSRSEGEHERPSVGMSRDVAEMEDHDADDERDHQDDSREETPSLPVVAVRVRANDQRQQQRSYPPFREEISSDMSEHAPLQSPPSSMDTDGTPYFPQSGELYSIPSISLTPPASPRHQRPTNQQQSPGQEHHHRQQHASNDSRAYEDPSEASARRERYPGSEPTGLFSSWTFGFAVGCVVAGFGGMFMEELMELAGVYLKTSSFTLSRAEQREMNRRLDVLQEELLNFRASTNDIEHQSQRMVQEVRSHLVKMKTERERHQQMISKEMDMLRMYVQAITNELVEDEKKEIRKRLMETIADTRVEPRPQKMTREVSSSDSDGQRGLEKHKQQEEAVRVEPQTKPTTPRAVEVEIAAVEDAAASLFETLDEETVMRQIDKAISLAIHELPSGHKKNNSQHATLDASTDSASSSFSWELLVVLAGIAFIAAAVGKRVQQANRRKNIYRSRRLWRQQQDTETSKVRTGASGDDSEVETVEFFRTASESGLDDRQVEDDDDDDGDASVYSEEQKESEEGDDVHAHEEERMSSEEGEYDFQPAELNAENSEIEEIDESPSSSHDEPPTPYRRGSKQRLQVEDRLTDDSPVRRSPRLHMRSTLSHMR